MAEFEHGCEKRAVYGEALLKHLPDDLTERFRLGFSQRSLSQMGLFYSEWKILQIDSAKSVQNDFAEYPASAKASE